MLNLIQYQNNEAAVIPDPIRNPLDHHRDGALPRFDKGILNRVQDDRIKFVTHST